MSVSRWAYEPWKCDGEFCVGDCDHCNKAYWILEDEEENDGEEQMQ